MKITFLHLGDIHFSDTDTNSKKYVSKIVNALRIACPIEKLFIIITGDIAHSGANNEYKNAKVFLDRLVYSICQQYDLKERPVFGIVPGNHDVALDKKMDHKCVQDAYNNNTIESLSAQEIKKQSNYYSFSRMFGCSSLKRELVLKKTYDIDGVKLQFNLINSALFSMYDQEKGLHYLPPEFFEILKEDTDADFIFTIMHHSYHWFNDTQKNELEEIILKQSTILFLGHEHNPDIQTLSAHDQTCTFIQAGGKLADRDDWTDSSFNITVFDTQSKKINSWICKLSSDKSVYNYQESPNSNITISKQKEFAPLSEFNNDILFKNSFQPNIPFTSYFVFPRIERQATGKYADTVEIIDEESFINFLYDQKRIYISGGTDYGKTTLLKYIFSLLSQEKVVLYCSIDDINSPNRKQVVKHVFEKIYGEKREMYSAFLQLPKEQKVIIIDDIHRIDTKRFYEFLSGIENEFEYIILASNTFVDFDIESLQRNASGDYAKCYIKPFYYDKREELVKKLIPLFIQKDPDLDHKSQIICDALKAQRTITIFTPALIIQFVQYFCKNFEDAASNDGIMFGKVFESNLTSLITPYVKNLTVDKVFIILDKIAYYIHKNKSYPLSEHDLISIIEEYAKDYDKGVNANRVIETITQAKILVLDEKTNTYRFLNNSYLAYFAAREIRRQYHETKDDTVLKRTVEFSCFGINADILMVLTYLSDDANMLETIVETAVSYVDSWTAFSAEKGNSNQEKLEFIMSPQPLPFVKPSGNWLEKHKGQETQKERALDQKNNVLRAVDIYEFNESDIDLLTNQLIRATSLMIVVSRCLPNFEHMMKNSLTEKFVDAIYKLPHQIFYKWALEIEKNKDIIAEGIFETLCEAYATNPKIKLISKEEILLRLRRDAIGQYLNMVYTAIMYSTKPNTIDYLNDYDYAQNKAFRIMHAMILEKSEKIEDLIEESKIIKETSSGEITEYLIKYILSHCIVFSKTISRQQMQKIESTLLNLGDKGHPQLLVSRWKKTGKIEH